MNNNSKYILGSGVIIAIVLACAALFSMSHSTTSPTVNPVKTVTLAGGAPDLSNSPYLDVNGVVEWYSQANIPSGAGLTAPATTTICSFQSPVANSTTGSAFMQSVSVRFGGQSTSGVTFSVGTSTSPAGITGTLVSGIATATSTGYFLLGTQGDATIASTTYTNVVLSGLASTTGGLCQAEFTQF